MKISSPVGKKRARLEIIPLIDIMFFLLASFMMVSMSMILAQALKMDLPTPTASTTSKKPSMIHIEVDAIGDAFVEKQRKSLPELFMYLTNRHAAETNIPAYIKGNPEATHGQVIAILDLCRRAGIQKVSFNITASPKKSSP